jgi:hypothetical protein
LTDSVDFLKNKLPAVVGKGEDQKMKGKKSKLTALKKKGKGKDKKRESKFWL